MEQIIKVTGIVRFREIPPDWTEDDFRYWWIPEVDCDGRIIRKARMSEKEKSRWTRQENSNMLLTAGRNTILAFVGSNMSTTLYGFAGFLGLGTTNIVQVYPADTSVAGEFFRKQPASATVSGNSVDIATVLTTTDAVGTLTNGGLIGGQGATSSLGTGNLYVKSLIIPSFTKANGASYTVDWGISIN